MKKLLLSDNWLKNTKTLMPGIIGVMVVHGAYSGTPDSLTVVSITIDESESYSFLRNDLSFSIPYRHY